jgi:ribosomal protein L9
MANNENKASKAAEAVKDNRVEVFVPKGYANDDPNLFVSVNGVNYLLPKGKKSMVPDFVAAEIERSKRAAEKQDEKMEQMLEASK